jgi:hypothetical protein
MRPRLTDDGGHADPLSHNWATSAVRALLILDDLEMGTQTCDPYDLGLSRLC